MRLNNNNEKLAYKQIVGLPKIEHKNIYLLMLRVLLCQKNQPTIAIFY